MSIVKNVFGVPEQVILQESTLIGFTMEEFHQVFDNMRLNWVVGTMATRIDEYDFHTLLSALSKVFPSGISVLAAYVVVKNSNALWQEIQAVLRHGSSDTLASYFRVLANAYGDTVWQRIIFIPLIIEEADMRFDFHDVSGVKAVSDIWRQFGSVGVRAAYPLLQSGVDADAVLHMLENEIDPSLMSSVHLAY